MGKELKISVRDLVEFIMRAGDLDERSAGAPEDVMLEGARMHRKLQREAGPDYTAEVPLAVYYPVHCEAAQKEDQKEDHKDSLKDLADTGDFCVLVEGRADGIFWGADPDNPIFGEAWTIDEIKTTYRKLGGMKEPEPVHLAQAKCYAYIYCLQNNLDVIRVRMTYCNLESQQILRFTREYTSQEISTWFDSLMREYARWARMEIDWEKKRNESLSGLDFPFAYREGQRELAVHVYHTICHGRKLFLEAPTGTGKTISVIFPALKAMGEEKADRLFYFTAKTVTGQVPLETFSLLREKGMRLKSLQLSAKDKICPLNKRDGEKRACNPKDCPRARGHYDRVNTALYDLLTREEDIRRDTLEAYGEKYTVCPFELGLDASLFADAVVGDYNYLFDPRARLKRFFAEGKGRKRYLFLVDEAHNLVDRGREMYSASLSEEDLKALRKSVREVYPALYKKLGRLSAAFKPYKSAFEEVPAPGAPGGGETGLPAGTSFLETLGGRERVLLAQEIDVLYDAACKVMEEMQAILQAVRRGTGDGSGEKLRQAEEAFLEGFFALSRFLSVYGEMEDEYQIYLEKRGRNIVVRLLCVDPSGKLAQQMDKGVSCVLFSATFLPIRYYKRLLGGTEQDYEVYARSSFDPSRLGVFTASDVTSRFKSRGEEQYARIASGIYNSVSQRHGNYMIFFPSYGFMDKVLEQYAALYPDEGETAFAVQRPQMTEEERKDFLDRFDEVSDDKSLLGFCVLGGIFGEGIDLQKDRLIGAVIVGTGLPQVGAQREILKRYFDSRGENGFDYAYRYPGMNKVLQAAGRVIRTADDVGVVVLMDERFCLSSYRRLFPAHWTENRITDSREIGDKVSRFWDEWL